MFERFCLAHGLCALPAEPATVAAFLGEQVQAGLKPSTLGRRLAAIKYRHAAASLESPTQDERVKAVLRGARRTLGVAPRRMAPVLTDTLKDMVRSIPKDMKGLRDKALLLICWSGALHRSDLVAIDIEHVQFTADGIRLLIPRSKTDQIGEGQQIAILSSRNSLYCPVKALREWIEAADIRAGALFLQVRRGGHVARERLTSQTVAILVKQYVGKTGLNSKDFAAHSLRSGPLSSAAANGASVIKLKQLSRHKSTDVLVNNYIHPVDLFRDHCMSGLL